jgi:hypothetical protein
MTRFNDEARQALVTSARKLIYEQCHGVVSSIVEDLLREKSLVPNTVSQFHHPICAERIFTETSSSRI